MRRLARIGALITSLACMAALTGMSVSYIAPRTITMGTRCLCLDRGMFEFERFERFETARVTGSEPRSWILLPDAADKPLWPVALTAGAGTVVLVHLGRRRIPPGHCRCGYDLTG